MKNIYLKTTDDVFTAVEKYRALADYLYILTTDVNEPQKEQEYCIATNINDDFLIFQGNLIHEFFVEYELGKRKINLSYKLN